MSISRESLAWLLALLLSIIVITQFIGANKAEQKAQDAEDQAKQLDAQVKDFKAQSDKALAAAEARYQASLQESSHWRAELARIESRPASQMASGSNRKPADELSAVVKTLPTSQGTEAAKSTCEPVYDQDHPSSLLTIEGFQVSVCDGNKPVVQAEAAVELYDAKALLAKTQTSLAETTAKLVLEEKDLAQYKAAEKDWKKAAKKSRIKRVLGVAEKVGLFAAGVYLGHRF